MPTVRVAVPGAMQRSLLRKNAKACCVCKSRHVGFNFHHIDGDASNTVEENLAVLCVLDHDAHHRPIHYRSGEGVSTANHLNLDAVAIKERKDSWEAFVAEAAQDAPSVLATASVYGDESAVHSMKLTFHWASGKIEFERVYHLHDGPVEEWVELAVAEVAWLGRNVKFVLLDQPMPVEHCPCCRRSLTMAAHIGT